MWPKKHALRETDDPVANLRRCWDLHVEFGLSRPAFYLLMYGEGRSGGTQVASEARDIPYRLIARAAAAGRLRMSVERALRLFEATSVGVVLMLMESPSTERDLGLSTLARESLLRTITTEGGPESAGVGSLVPLAVALRQALRYDDTTPLTQAERELLGEWINRIADAAASPDT